MNNLNINTSFAVIDLCRNNYNKRTYEHVCRVTDYACSHFLLNSEDERRFVYCVAMCHDLLEDTDVTKSSLLNFIEQFGDDLYFNEKSLVDCVSDLTREENESYNEYLCRVKNSNNKFSYVVKLSDMKDHLMQTETLTDKLKEKYINSIGCLL